MPLESCEKLLRGILFCVSGELLLICLIVKFISLPHQLGA